MARRAAWRDQRCDTCKVWVACVRGEKRGCREGGVTYTYRVGEDRHRVHPHEETRLGGRKVGSAHHVVHCHRKLLLLVRSERIEGLHVAEHVRRRQERVVHIDERCDGWLRIGLAGVLLSELVERLELARPA